MKPNAEHIAPDNQEVAERFPTFRKELQEFVTQVLNNLRVSQGWSWEKLFEELDSIKNGLGSADHRDPKEISRLYSLAVYELIQSTNKSIGENRTR
jgi:hypothetical protein